MNSLSRKHCVMARRWAKRRLECPGVRPATYSTCMLGIALTVSIDEQIDGPSRFGVEVIKHSLCQNPFQHKCGAELEHHAAATGMDGISHAFPTCDLLGTVDTWRANIALALGRDLGCFRNDEPGAGPLGIIQSAQQSWHIAGPGAASSQGRHDNAVRQREGSCFDGGEEISRALSREFLHGQFSVAKERGQGHGRNCWRQRRFAARIGSSYRPRRKLAERKRRYWPACSDSASRSPSLAIRSPPLLVDAPCAAIAASCTRSIADPCFVMELLKPGPGLAPRVSGLVVRSKNH